MLSRKLLSTLVLGSLMSGCASLPTQHSEVMSRGGQRSGGFTANLVVEPVQTNESQIVQTSSNNQLSMSPDTYPTSSPASAAIPRGTPRSQPSGATEPRGNFNQTATVQQAAVIAQGLNGNGNTGGARINVVWQPLQSNVSSISQDVQSNFINGGDLDGLRSQPSPGTTMMNGSSAGSSLNQTATLQQANVIIQDSTLPNQQNRNTTRSNRGSRR